MDKLYWRVQQCFKEYRNLAIPFAKVALPDSKHARLSAELAGNPYTLPTLTETVQKAKSYTCFEGPTVQLRVIGKLTTMDERTCIKVCRRVCCIQKLFSTTPSKLIIWLFVTSPKRRMPTNGAPIQPVNINGGYTYLHGNEIFVLRREEFPKVILHEVIHHTKLHIPSWDPTSLKTLYQHFHINQERCSADMHTCQTSLEPNEAVVETYAEVLHMMFLSLEYQVPLLPLYKQELRHALEQCKRILQYQFLHMPLWNEGTHAYAYIVYRTILLLTFDTWQGSYKSDSITQVILETFESERFKTLIRQAKIRDHKSLRMTLFGDM